MINRYLIQNKHLLNKYPTEIGWFMYKNPELGQKYPSRVNIRNYDKNTHHEYLIYPWDQQTAIGRIIINTLLI